MPRCYFHLDEDGYRTADEEGLELPRDAIQDRAIFEARNLIASDVMTGKINLQHRIEVTDDTGAVLTNITFAEAVEFV